MYLTQRFPKLCYVPTTPRHGYEISQHHRKIHGLLLQRSGPYAAVCKHLHSVMTQSTSHSHAFTASLLNSRGVRNCPSVEDKLARCTFSSHCPRKSCLPAHFSEINNHLLLVLLLLSSTRIVFHTLFQPTRFLAGKVHCQQTWTLAAFIVAVMPFTPLLSPHTHERGTSWKLCFLVASTAGKPFLCVSRWNCFTVNHRKEFIYGGLPVHCYATIL